jgi:transcriptional regulator with XRE-family HTH domain
MIEFLGYDLRPVPDTLGGMLRHRRTAMGLSLNALARRLDLDPGTLWKVEQGRPGRYARVLAAVAAFLELDGAPAPDTLASRIVEYRRTKGVSRAELGRDVGVHPDTVRGWESGRQLPVAEHLLRIEGLLSLDRRT